MSAQGMKCGACEFEARHLNRSEWGDRDLGDVDIIEADDGEVIGYAQAGAVELVQYTDRCHVVGADNCGGHGLAGKQLLHGCYAAFERMVAFNNPVRIRRYAGFL